ncbi:MAG: hypothetical protein ACYC9J_09265 [Sulfuricaulis sp.]
MAHGAPAASTQRCGACRFFTGEPAALERAIPGLNILSSAYGSVRANTGLCEQYESFVTFVTPACDKFNDRNAS